MRMKKFLKFKTLFLVLSLVLVSVTSIIAAKPNEDCNNQTIQPRIIQCPECRQIGDWTYRYYEDTGEVFLIICNKCGYEYYY